LQKNILFTYDYELYLGSKSGTVNNCLLKPAEKVLNAHNKYSAKAIFFVDILFLWRLKNEQPDGGSAKEEYQAIVSQLQNAVVDGHYIFPHIHPHWLDAKYLSETGEWDLSNYKLYRFSSLSAFEQERVFKISIDLIREITSPVCDEYLIDAYRAGGWSIQPFSEFKSHFLKYGIKYDFSVIAGKKIISDAHTFDFQDAPSKKIYSFEDDVCVENINGQFIEFTISSVVTSKLVRWCYFKLTSIKQRLGLNNVYGDGHVIQLNVKEDIDVINNNQHRWVASLEGLNIITFIIFFKQIYKRSYFHFISHPKLLTPLEIIWLKILLISLKVFKINTDFRKMG